MHICIFASFSRRKRQPLNNISPELFIENARVRVYHLHINFNFYDKEGP